MHRSKIPYFFLALAAVLAVAALVLLITRPGVKPPVSAPLERAENPEVTEVHAPIAALEKSHAADPSETVLKDLGIGVAAVDPEDLVSRIAQALESGDFNAAGQLIGKNALDPQTLERLQSLVGAIPLKLREPGFREVGEMELNALARWSLELEGPEAGRDRIFLDLRRLNGKWAVEKLRLPPAAGEPIPKAVVSDPLGIADAFLQAVLQQDFEFARDYVDSNAVSDAKIAGLCILFEEGGYRLRSSKPLRSMFERDDIVGYLANVETTDGTQSAQFALTLRQAPGPAHWLVSEINLDQLLADYARRVAGGDLYYSPLVKNPSGGDTLALYFEFDEDQINPRTRRQLEIVALILRTDPNKTITLSGHTDALGTEAYNDHLSSRRAKVVRDFLVNAGVAESQIITVAKGASQPRRPNFTEAGEDDPDGRRANRRTEVYLDF